MRVLLFTDTLGDINGVARFIRNMGQEAAAAGETLGIVTSTRRMFEVLPGIRNFPPRWARPLPGYADLDIVVPPVGAMVRYAREFHPDVIHVSTPGPVGLVGRWAAGRLGVPLAGVYHTDFPAYAAHLFGDEVLANIATAAMRWFYRPFGVVIGRTRTAAHALPAIGIEGDRLAWLRAAVRVEDFQSPRDPGWERRVGLTPGAFRLLYVGRVSVEKNLAFLARVWRLVRPRLAAAGLAPELVVVGDGPYRAVMEGELAGEGAVFLGVLRGRDLARAYAAGDVFVFPSETDTLGQVVLEAQAAGLPVIVSTRGGPRDVVREDETGIVAPATEAAWVEAIDALALRLPRGLMGRQAVRWAEALPFRASFLGFWGEHERLLNERVLEGQASRA